MHCSARRSCGRFGLRVMSLVMALCSFGLAGIALAAVLPAGTAQLDKLDAPLRLFATQPETAVRFFRERLSVPAGFEKAATDGRLAVLIRLPDNADTAITTAALRSAGVDVGSRLGPIVTAELPISALAALAGLDAVVSVEMARPLHRRLNASVPATGAATLRSGAAPNYIGLTGKGVVVGIIDDGIDFRHSDFRNLDGTTRLLSLWDQRAAGAAGQPPTGYNYGGECTPGMINEAIGGTAAACTQPSSGAHGTHVAGIAAGNGSATGASQAAYRFIGMAPEADLLSANGGQNNTVIDAIAWMKAKAAPKPLVINMSFGSYFGARDGTSNYEVALSSAGAAGVILVGAAGNEADDRVRAEGPLAQGGELAFDVNVPAGKTFVRLESWYVGTDSYSVTIQGPSCPATAPIGAGTSVMSFETACGLVGALNAGPFAINDDRQVQVIMRNGTSPLMPGTWRITFSGTQVGGGTATVSVVTGEDGNDMTVTAVNGQAPTGKTTQILTDVSSARRVIAVASYNTNYAWTTLSGAPSDAATPHGAVGDLSTFSSRGPRRMCSNPVKCPQIMKPEITAPGAMIMSTLASDRPASNGDAAVRERDGLHIAFNGTSMATPHVTGAIALLLQKKPSLTPEEVKQLLYANAQKTSFTPAVPTYTGADVPAAPNHDWGYGVLDVAKAAAAIPAAGTAQVLTAFEFLYQPENRYFLTIEPAEAAAIDAGAAGAGWLRTGFTFKAYTTAGDAPAGAVPVCRFYGSVTPGPNSHFFTANAAECQSLRDLQATTPNTQKRWNYEGIAFRIAEPDLAKNCAVGLLPVLRAYNNGFTRGIDSNHRFTSSQDEYQKMIAQNWAGEGVVFCSPQ